ncbi:Phosphoribulokinase/uridine kinase [Penicillium riverlandense]|uniref:Phosphoribulokinase/uridine kinase n=1 Tax=Penicillium riverlandense TaxID=1903569 RepID=UPI0025499F1D|nr:Phosphoribulokinase/uridine kinase [Penicillium riverlandense]KAJ5815538.1 Phosphoribulokinase/uridine kinase [Penicillium riverlandense]
MGSQQDRAVIIGISGPSSSGKTTLARLLQRVFCGVRLETNGSDASQDRNKDVTANNEDASAKRLNTFIVHEDDFYYPDDKIPWTTTPSGAKVQDWDTADAIDIDFLAQALAYVRSNGHLPPRLQSKEDQNAVTDSGVDDAVIAELRDEVEKRISSKLKSTTATTENHEQGQGHKAKTTIAFLEGFLLFSPPHPSQPPSQQKGGSDKAHTLHPVHSNIHLPLFLPCSYNVVKTRREGRSGYVTIGPGPEPPANEDPTLSSTGANTNTGSAEVSETDKMHQNMESRSHMPLSAVGGAQGTDADANATVPNNDNKKGLEKPAIDLNSPDDRPPQNFWTDPPGYVDDVVWPRYVEDHAWLLLPEEEYRSYMSQSQSHETEKMTTAELIARVGDGSAIRTDVGVEVCPGLGELPMSDVVRWAVDKVLAYYEA